MRGSIVPNEVDAFVATRLTAHLDRGLVASRVNFAAFEACLSSDASACTEDSWPN
jgi:hypothetical protein